MKEALDIIIAILIFCFVIGIYRLGCRRTGKIYIPREKLIEMAAERFIGVFEPPKMVKEGDVIRFRSSGELTYFGEKLIAFIEEILKEANG